MKIQDPNKIIFAKKKINKLVVFIDLDGVCSYWEEAAAKACGIDYKDEEIRKELKNGKRLEKFVGGDSKMWPMIDKEGVDWWANMERLPWADKLYASLTRVSKDFLFLSSPSNNPICAQGKIMWMKKHFGDHFKRFLIGRDKHMCAHPNTLLIDDNKKKCDKFEEWGGNVFRWPHPLKLIDGDINVDDTIKELMDYIEELKK